jgi:hypothetical protein
MHRNLPTPRPSLLLIGALISCAGDQAAKTPPADAASGNSNEAAVPPDSLVLRLGDGTELWYTLSREDKDTTGATCLERTLEIRAQSRKIPVPLLYTRDVPRPINDSIVSARIWSRCAPGDEYRVNLRTGQPVRASK